MNTVIPVLCLTLLFATGCSTGRTLRKEHQYRMSAIEQVSAEIEQAKAKGLPVPQGTNGTVSVNWTDARDPWGVRAIARAQYDANRSPVIIVGHSSMHRYNMPSYPYYDRTRVMYPGPSYRNGVRATFGGSAGFSSSETRIGVRGVYANPAASFNGRGR